ncbi:MAG: chromosome segregation protein SMC [Actinomycetia bacterium]|nr:chromosome segregation protein SMC [Actinomycetes bacterium]
MDWSRRSTRRIPGTSPGLRQRRRDVAAGPRPHQTGQVQRQLDLLLRPVPGLAGSSSRSRPARSLDWLLGGYGPWRERNRESPLFLKTLTIKGFKSFADVTSVDLEPGITVVVGPNGSGKSNVVDAIGWVLGAQAPSAVRSQKMDDVIFAGTTNRPALGRAEVSLTLDNSAGLLPIEFNEVTLTRTLFRTGDSEYSINRAPCRLLDIQELLSDSGVGRQQHVIISQGQIDAVLNAKAEERRLIIEEAAGVLKYRKRKERAERKLTGTEANLVRLQDLLREVRRQLRPLEKQADAARRHGDVVSELHSLQVFVAGRQLAGLKSRLETGALDKAELASRERHLKTELARLDTDVMATEARLSAVGGDDLGDALGRLEALRERGRGLANVLAERRRGIDAARDASVDAEVVASLEAEAARLTKELGEVDDHARALVPDAREVERAEQALADERTRFESALEEGRELPAGQAAEVRGELSALRGGIDRARAEHERVTRRLRELQISSQRLEAEGERLRVNLASAEQDEVPLVDELDQTESRRVRAAGVVDELEAVRRGAEADRQAWTARAEALELALDEARARAGAEKLAQIDGVLGTLLDLIEVDPGWEAAFEAAAGEALAAVVVDSVEVGRRALDALHGGSFSGAVLALGTSIPAVSVPSVGESVRGHVRSSRADVEGLLDLLVGRAVAVQGGWPEAVDLALSHPDAVVVTTDGDRFGASGWRVGVAGTGATRSALDEAHEQAAIAAEQLTAAERDLAAARRELEEAQQIETEISRKLDANDSRSVADGDALQRVETERRDSDTEGEGLRERLTELDERLAREGARAAELGDLLPILESEDAAAEAEERRLDEVRDRLDQRSVAVAALRRDLEVRAAAVEERRGVLRSQLTTVEQRLERNVTEREQAASRRAALDGRAVAVDRLTQYVAVRLETVETELNDLRERRRRQSEATRAVSERLDGLRRQRHDHEVELSEVRERSQRVEIAEAETSLRIEAAVEALRRVHDVEPDTAINAEHPILTEGVSADARVRELERELKLMGPINPLALEEYEALQERHLFLQEQLDDVKGSRKELTKIIRAVDEEIVNVFAAAFSDVSQNFEHLFGTLFPGGTGKLGLTDPDNLLETGIEVEARPSGKNVRKLSLLSGGERSLTALAYLFAVFRSRPSPFYVMDEVEAALDDVNLHRFLDLVAEFRQDAQLIIVSHQKRTMEAADILYGVTMQPGGSSKIVSERMQDGEQLRQSETATVA